MQTNNLNYAPSIEWWHLFLKMYYIDFEILKKISCVMILKHLPTHVQYVYKYSVFLVRVFKDVYIFRSGERTGRQITASI